MSARTQRLAELIARRDALSAQIHAMAPDLDLPDPDPLASAPVARLSALARHLVHDGHTHAETGDLLHIPASSVGALIAPRRTR